MDRVNVRILSPIEKVILTVKATGYDSECPEEGLEVGRIDMTENDARQLLDRAAILRHPCDRDLMLFFGRHPRTLLASESLAACLGYDIKQIADSLELLLAAGLIKRMQTSAHPARLYLLMPDDSNHEWLGPLVNMGSTRQGRAALRKALSPPSREEP